jgi:23S rRNA pseudouridine1911/1915/1917 synthase
VSEPETRLLQAASDAAADRLDRVLARAFADLSRGRLQALVRDGRVKVAGAVVRESSARVQPGAEIVLEIPAAAPAEPRGEPIALAVVYEDDEIVVIDKPAGLVVHPAPGHPRGTLVHALLHHCRDLAGVGGVLRPGIVHRLDAGTSGVMVVAKTDVAHAALSREFREHTIERVYHAWVRGAPGAESGRVERAIGRHPTDRKRMSVAARGGREARTAWRVVARWPAHPAARLEVRPETGRTHQIRVHLASQGLPILGDPVYGRARAGLPGGVPLARPALHAFVLGFGHPLSGERMRFEAPPPADLAALEAALSGAPR